MFPTYEFRSTMETLKSRSSETEIAVGKKLGSAAKGHREARSSRLENSRNNEPLISSYEKHETRIISSEIEEERRNA